MRPRRADLLRHAALQMGDVISEASYVSGCFPSRRRHTKTCPICCRSVPARTKKIRCKLGLEMLWIKIICPRSKPYGRILPVQRLFARMGRSSNMRNLYCRAACVLLALRLLGRLSCHPQTTALARRHVFRHRELGRAAIFMTQVTRATRKGS